MLQLGCDRGNLQSESSCFHPSEKNIHLPPCVAYNVVKILRHDANKNWGILRLRLGHCPVTPVINPPEFWGACL